MTTETRSRQEQILHLLLDSTQGLCIDEMAAKLEISRNAITQHISTLERDHLIQKHTLNSTGGRPSRTYVLTNNGINHFQKQYSWFCNLVLSELKTELGSQAFSNFITKLGVKLAESLKQQDTSQQSDAPIASLLAMMQSLGYHAEGTENAIQAHNCVYHDLAQLHPELCDFDRSLMSTYLDTPIEQTHCKIKNDNVCTFLIKKN